MEFWATRVTNVQVCPVVKVVVFRERISRSKAIWKLWSLGEEESYTSMYCASPALLVRKALA